MGTQSQLDDSEVKIVTLNLMKDGNIIPGRIELFRYLGEHSLPTQDLAGLAVPPNRGILSVSFETQDLDAASETMIDLGARPIDVPVTAEMLGLGSVRLQTFLGPDGECLEVYEGTKT